MVLTLFGLAAILLLYARPLLPGRKLSLSMIMLSLSITITALAGDIALSAISLGQTIAYTAVLTLLLLVWAYRMPLTRVLCVWMPSQIPMLRWCMAGFDRKIARWITANRKENKAVVSVHVPAAGPWYGGRR